MTPSDKPLTPALPYRTRVIAAIREAITRPETRAEAIATIEALAACLATCRSSLDGPREPNMQAIEASTNKLLRLLKVPDA